MPEKTNHNDLLQLLHSQEGKLSRVYANMSKELASVLRRYRVNNNSDLWFKNLPVRKEVQLVMARYEKILLKHMEANINLAWDLSNNHNDEFVNQYTSGINVPKSASTLYFDRNTKALNAFINRGRKGFKFSNRVWDLSRQTQKQLEFFIAEGLTNGRSAAKLSQDLRKYLKDPEKRFRRVRDKVTGKLKLSVPAKDYHPGRGVYRSSYKNALRLSRSEVNIAYRSADHERSKNLPFVTGITVHLSNAHPTYDICDELQGDYPKGFKYVGWHTLCLCFVTKKLLPKSEFIKHLNGLPIDPKYLKKGIPKRAVNYLSDNADKINNMKSAPYFIQDNFKNTKDGFLLKSSI